MAVNKTQIGSLGSDHIADQMGLAFLFLGQKNYFKKQHSSEEKIQVPPNRVRPMTSPDVSGQETSRT